MKKPVLFSILSLCIGVIFCYWQIYLPLEAARNHSETINYSYKGVIIGPLGILVALIGLFAPKLFTSIPGTAPTPRENKIQSIYSVIFMIVVILTIFGVSYWFKHALSQLGYTNL